MEELHELFSRIRELGDDAQGRLTLRPIPGAEDAWEAHGNREGFLRLAAASLQAIFSDDNAASLRALAESQDRPRLEGLVCEPDLERHEPARAERVPFAGYLVLTTVLLFLTFAGIGFFTVIREIF